MNIVENIYNKLAIEKAIIKANQQEISAYTNNIYEACKLKDPTFNKTLEECAAAWTNWNFGKCGIGQEAQIECLATIFPSIKGLPTSGKKVIALRTKRTNDKDIISIEVGNGKSNITGIKSFDAINIQNNIPTLFYLKTTDIGKFSDSIGGGHQDNVIEELKTFITVVNNNEFIFNPQMIILVDGRSSDNIIKTCTPLIKNGSNIILSSCNKLYTNFMEKAQNVI